MNILNLYHRPGKLRILRNILDVLNSALWMEISYIIPEIYWSHFSSLWITVPSVPVITGITFAFTFHIFFGSSFSSWFFSISSSWNSCRLLFLYLSPLLISDFCLLSQCLVDSSIFVFLSGWSPTGPYFHDFLVILPSSLGRSKPEQISLYILPPCAEVFLRYFLSALRILSIVLDSMDLVLSTFFCAAMINVSAFYFRSAFPSH